MPKQPQSIFNPLKRLIIIAIIKMDSKKEIIKEFSFTLIPNRSNAPAINSIQGKIIAKKFTENKGRIL